MSQSNLIVVLNIVIVGLCAPAYAQTTSSTTADPNPPSMSETVKEFDQILANADRLRRGTTVSKETKSVKPVLLAIPQFRKATADLRVAIGEQKSMRDSLHSIEKLIKPFAEYFKDLKLKSSDFDVQEFKSYSQKDLMWETLTTAERIDNNLQIANKLLNESNRSGAVTIKTLQFYAEIDSDLKRLKWLADKVAAER